MVPILANYYKMLLGYNIALYENVVFINKYYNQPLANRKWIPWVHGSLELVENKKKKQKVKLKNNIWNIHITFYNLNCPL